MRGRYRTSKTSQIYRRSGHSVIARILLHKGATAGSVFLDFAHGIIGVGRHNGSEGCVHGCRGGVHGCRGGVRASGGTGHEVWNKAMEVEMTVDEPNLFYQRRSCRSSAVPGFLIHKGFPSTVGTCPNRRVGWILSV